MKFTWISRMQNLNTSNIVFSNDTSSYFTDWFQLKRAYMDKYHSDHKHFYYHSHVC